VLGAYRYCVFKAIVLGGEAESCQGHAASARHDLPVDIIAVALHQTLRHVAAIAEKVAHRGNSVKIKKNVFKDNESGIIFSLRLLSRW
jgi:hypothetical protein